ncbi:hypothetical protein ACFPRL_16720 [Pseudoclavibacter helvolus]
MRGLLTVNTWLPAVDDKLPVGELARAGRLCDADALGDARAERHVMHTRGVALHDQLTGGREPRVSNARGDDGRAGHGEAAPSWRSDRRDFARPRVELVGDAPAIADGHAHLLLEVRQPVLPEVVLRVDEVEVLDPVRDSVHVLEVRGVVGDGGADSECRERDGDVVVACCVSDVAERANLGDECRHLGVHRLVAVAGRLWSTPVAEEHDGESLSREFQESLRAAHGHRRLLSAEPVDVDDECLVGPDAGLAPALLPEEADVVPGTALTQHPLRARQVVCRRLEVPPRRACAAPRPRSIRRRC